MSQGKQASLIVVDIKPRGYCKGVVRALQLAKKTRLANPDEKISVIGGIVHNRFITAALDYYQIETLDQPGLSREELLSLVDHGIVILSAHGSPDQIKKLAKEKGLKVIDAVCPDVSSTHEQIKEAFTHGKAVIFVGKAGHPETEAVLANFPACQLVTNKEDVANLRLPPGQELVVTNQTTLSILEIQDIISEIIKYYPQAEIIDEICGATRVRQEAVLKNSKLDALVVVGDPQSNNTAMLAQIARECRIGHVFPIETVADLEVYAFQEGWKVGVTSGASTPTYLTEMVSDYLRKLDLANPAKFPKIDLKKILD